MSITAAIFGCAGPVLTRGERAFFTATDPLGFILFQRNIVDPDQVRALVADLRDCVGRDDAPVLTDQEGGRVMRLRPPHWPPRVTAAALGLADRSQPGRAAWLQGRLIAADLRALGITVDCAPVADVPVSGAHDVIGDRAFSSDPDIVAAEAGRFAEGLLAGGVLPVLKHLPGHGRAGVDSHLATPRVTASRGLLAAHDFRPFRALRHLPLAMTAHVVYDALDPARPATLSPVVIADVIRGEIGFDGLLLTDDLSMHALSGDFAWRTAEARAAGCDVALHCNGALEEMRPVAEAAGPLDADASARLRRALAMIAGRDGDGSCDHLQEELDRLLAQTFATGSSGRADRIDSGVS